MGGLIVKITLQLNGFTPKLKSPAPKNDSEYSI